MPSDKDILFEKVRQVYDTSNSIKDLKSKLEAQGIQTYNRNDKLCGVYYGKRKFRLKRSLGIDPELLRLKDRSQLLARIREKQDKRKSKNRER
ncbi:MAG: hypothetical protein EVB11_13095 [Winogradskyella sp.]|nr:MAG: hypothetical protein EVB11_13095 [Winogradskyella sp.]